MNFEAEDRSPDGATKHGGARPGAGRPRGKAPLARYEVKAIRALRIRTPESLPEQAKELAGEAFEAVVQVMRREVRGPGTQDVLRAAAMVREEICGPITQKHELETKGGLSFQLVLAKPEKQLEPGPEGETVDGDLGR